MNIETCLQSWLPLLQQIESEVGLLLRDRYIFREVMNLVDANPDTHKPNDFVEWMAHQYVRSATVRVRHQVDRDSRAASLENLLGGVAKHAHLLTRAWFVKQFSQDYQQEGSADRRFDRWSGSVGDHVDSSVLASMRDQLRQSCKPVPDFVDQRVAHRDVISDDKVDMPTWPQLDRAIDRIEQTTLDCMDLLRCGGPVTLLPAWQYDWMKVFDEPWRTRPKHPCTGAGGEPSC
jgi:hypothetical protein